MRLVQIIAKGEFELYGAMTEKERELRDDPRSAFHRVGPKGKHSDKWHHKKYKGWIWLERSLGGVVTAEVESRTDDQWQLLNAYLGFVNRHFAERIQTLTIHYRA